MVDESKAPHAPFYKLISFLSCKDARESLDRATTAIHDVSTPPPPPAAAAAADFARHPHIRPPQPQAKATPLVRSLSVLLSPLETCFAQHRPVRSSSSNSNSSSSSSSSNPRVPRPHHRSASAPPVPSATGETLRPETYGLQ